MLLNVPYALMPYFDGEMQIEYIASGRETDIVDVVLSIFQRYPLFEQWAIEHPDMNLRFYVNGVDARLVDTISLDNDVLSLAIC